LNFYFSDSNYPRDDFLLKFTDESNPEGWVPIEEFAKFNMVKRLTSDLALIVNCFRECDNVIVSDDGNRVKRKNPPPSIDQLNSRTVFVTGFSSSKNIDKNQVDELLSTFGKVLSVWSIKDSRKKKKSVFVEFETEDSALAAIAAGTINYDDEKEYELAIKSKVDYLNEQEQLKNQFQNNKRKKKSW